MFGRCVWRDFSTFHRENASSGSGHQSLTPEPDRTRSQLALLAFTAVRLGRVALLAVALMALALLAVALLAAAALTAAATLLTLLAAAALVALTLLAAAAFMAAAALVATAITAVAAAIVAAAAEGTETARRDPVFEALHLELARFLVLLAHG